MKNIFVFVLGVILCVSSAAWADEVDQLLPEPVSNQLRANTRTMIGAGVDSEEATKITRAMIQNRFQEREVIAAQQVVIEARTQGLPEKAVMNKAYEGMAKQVDARQIVAAMRQVQSRYAFSYRYAHELSKDQAAVQRIGGIAADAMAAGLAAPSMERIMAQLENRVRTMTVNPSELCVQTMLTARDMARLGVPEDMTVDMMTNALRHGYSDKDMKTLRQSFASQARNSSVNGLAKAYAAGIEHGQSAQSLSGSSGPGSGTSGSGGGSSGGSGGGGGGGR